MNYIFYYDNYYSIMFTYYLGEIIFRDLSLRYRPTLPLVIEKINFHILPKEKIGIVGRTGSGKTTLLKILSGELPCDSGTFQLNGNVLHLKNKEFFNEQKVQDFLIDHAPEQLDIDKKIQIARDFSDIFEFNSILPE